MSLRAVTCEGCGGAVALEVGAAMPRCLFCGSEALREPEEIDESIEPPHAILTFQVDESTADDAFRTFAKSSFWYPDDIRQAKLELKRLLLPAWLWSGRIETHYAGLVRAGTRSGSRPVAGSEVTRMEGVLIPASTALSQKELHDISPFTDDGGVPFVEDDVDTPYELGSLTRTAARQAGLAAMESLHQQRITQQLSAKSLNVSSLQTEMEGRPVLLPIYIGAYRRNDNIYRIVINGQTGELTGDAPISWLKILGAIMAALGCVLMVLLFISIFLAIISQF
ncbi:MAG: hypothetical protein AAFV53_19050 [Myxococcota bacterium]